MPDAGDSTDVVDAPAVVAVVVANNPGDYFAEALLSLANQDYENLSVLVIDAGSDEPIADRVAEVLPEAYLHRLAGEPGWSVAANQAMELVSGSPFLLLCHDDVALEPTCVSALMKELYRNNGGIAGPKLVSWEREDRLTQIGMGSDRFGVMVDQVERGEFDQDQYDAVRDVFVIPGGVQLVRADLFAALGGFDPMISLLGEDLDLCWRAHAAGARVLVVPDAKARHLENMENRMPVRMRRRLLTRHRLRTVLTTAERRSMFTTVPLAFMLILLESLYSLVAGRRSQARDVLSAIPWNLTRLDDVRRNRQNLKKIRSFSDSEVARLQVGGSARISNFSRGQVSAGQDRIEGMVGSVRSSFAGEKTSNVRDATVLGFLLAVMLVFGSRHLLTRGVAPVGQMPDIPDGMTLLNEWMSGWRSSGTGGPGNAPSALPLFALGRAFFFWGSGVFDTLVSMGAVFFGPIAVYRSLRPLGSSRASMLAAIAYACNPLVLSSFSAGRWESLVVWAAAPYLLVSLLKVLAVAPFGSERGLSGPGIIDRNAPVRLIRFAFLVAVVASFAPSVVPLAVIAALVAFAVSATFGYGMLKELLLAAVLAVVGAITLHAPWSWDFFRGPSWDWVVGPPSPEASVDSLQDLLQFSPGAPDVPGLLVFGLLLAAGVSLAVARKDLFPFAVFGWASAVVFWLIPWADRRGWIPFGVPTAESLLAFSAAGLALSVAVGVRSFETRREESPIPARFFRPAAALGSIGLIGLVVVGMSSTVSGTWEAPTQSFTNSTEFLLDRQYEAADIAGDAGRVLWIGDPSVMTLDPAFTQSGVSYAVYDGGRAPVQGRWQPVPVGHTDAIGRQLDLASGGEVVRLGRLLAPYGVDLVVVVDQLAPSPYDGPSIAPDAAMVRGLSQQLDLERVPGVPDLIVYRNAASGGPAPLLASSEQAQASSTAALLDLDLSSGSAEVRYEAPGRWRVEIPQERAVLLPVPVEGLSVTEARDEVVSGIDGLAVLPSGDEGSAVIEYTARWRRRAAIIGQMLLVSVGALLGQTRREEVFV